jgi:hypothetical protein
VDAFEVLLPAANPHRDHPIMHMPRLTFVLMLALAAVSSACSRRQPVTQTMTPEAQKAADAARQEIDAMPAKLAKLAPECMLGSARQARGTWVTPSHTDSESVQPSRTVFRFDTPLKANAFRVAFNQEGMRALDKIEVRDADGNWHPAWPGLQSDVPATCEYVLLQQSFEDSPRMVSALRISLYFGPAHVTEAEVGLLQEAPQAGGT